MSADEVRRFIHQHLPVTCGLAALAAKLDAQSGGPPLDPALDGRIDELLGAIGVRAALDGINARDGRALLAEIRHQLPFDAKLLYAETRATSWSYADDAVLEAVGEYARGHAHALTRAVIPALDGLAGRFDSFLDIGVGVGGLAIELAGLWPSLRIVGIDVFAPSLRLARENVARAGLGDRIELREESADQIADVAAFDLIWVPLPFMPERVIRPTTERVRSALRPGGWAVYALTNPGALEPRSAAFWRLRTAMWGGPDWTPAAVEAMLRDAGLRDVRTLPAPPGSPVALVAARHPAD